MFIRIIIQNHFFIYQQIYLLYVIHVSFIYGERNLKFFKDYYKWTVCNCQVYTTIFKPKTGCILSLNAFLHPFHCLCSKKQLKTAPVSVQLVVPLWLSFLLFQFCAYCDTEQKCWTPEYLPSLQVLVSALWCCVMSVLRTRKVILIKMGKKR